LCAFLTSSMHAAYPAHLMHLDMIALIFDEAYKFEVPQS